ncbi:MAG: hypothetical protein RLZZ385_1726 [Pseudomonadota bacterium]|jgi:histidine triad (HIT) family protein
MPADCLFCRIIAGDIPSNKVYEDDELLAFRDINPVAPQHILIIPRQHISAIDAAEAAHAPLLGRMLLRAATIADETGMAGDGFRLVINTGRHGGQTVFHLHLHLLGGRQLQWPPG